MRPCLRKEGRKEGQIKKNKLKTNLKKKRLRQRWALVGSLFQESSFFSTPPTDDEEPGPQARAVQAPWDSPEWEGSARWETDSPA